MTIENEELLHKFVRAGMIMRHIDGEGPCPHKHGHAGKNGVDTCGCKSEAHDDCGCKSEVHGARFEMGPDAEHPHGPHGHGPGAHPMDGPGCHGHGHHRRGQARVLTMIAMQEGINQKDLAFLLGIRPQTLGEMLGKLEECGLIQRKKSQTDARVIQLFLTDEGRARAAEIAERRAMVAADLFAALTDEEKDQLSAILDKLGAELDARRPKRCCKHAEENKPVQA